MLFHNYPIYIAIWLVVSLLTLWLFKVVSRKMRETEDKQTKNSFFTILVVIGLPLLLVSVLGPLVFIIGDKNMWLPYRLVWSGLILIFVIYFFIKQRTPKEEDQNLSRS
jgi:L-asparagine transporter-like permease